MIKYINYTNELTLSLYESKYKTLFNEYNRETINMLNIIKELLKKDYFEVPYYDKKMIWGAERIYYPFSSKLFKIVNTFNNDTSIQLHPLKNEEWYLLQNSTIYNGIKWEQIEKGKKVTIPSSTVHCMKKGGQVFEIQNNDIFNDNETLRIEDKNGRNTSNINDILKHLMPNLRKKLSVENIKETKNINNDIFLFIIDGYASINGKQLDKNKLYFIKKNKIRELITEGNIVIDEAKYYI